MNDWLFASAIVAVGMANVVIGLRWSRIDHNPWADKPLGGIFSGPSPSLLPASLSVEAINARGRRMAILSPIAAVAMLVFFLHDRHHF